MDKLSYSFHISNRRSAIRNSVHLLGVEKHNHRKAEKYKNNPLTSDNVILVGTNKLYKDVQDIYLNEFEESRILFNKKQKRKDRIIDDYFKKISNDEQTDLAVEVIIQVGHMEFWEKFTQAEKKLMTPFFKNQIKKLQELLPNFKIANAVIHYDEKSPHIQLVGVPIRTDCNRGMSKQVSKGAVFSRESLRMIQEKMREGVDKALKNIYSTELLKEKFGNNFELSLKPKTPGRNRDIFISEYIEMKEKIRKDLEKEKNSYIEKANIELDYLDDIRNEKLDKLDDLNDELDDIFDIRNEKLDELNFLNEQIEFYSKLTPEQRIKQGLPPYPPTRDILPKIKKRKDNENENEL